MRVIAVAPAAHQADPAGHDAARKTILCVARLVPRKNVDTLVAAFGKATTPEDPDPR